MTEDALAKLIVQTVISAVVAYFVARLATRRK